mmetsp:Transcript_1634/g.2685  ORF Transcript_1634/g.2685 Transcript_1634/m.2685 type:complete len:277 (-) Transcript_1634:416-1246(-)|eukprot:CAMPEP_0174988450 /NCGR_PEP_ID=MMETSP0004_2-20121128/20133_1 /TAXON_ID=420556 /ORGANISM="Ochromonas sp., Strain CCMP1393" /LENGTH=276 /DNA_ID=CAMNT_0016241669 /DNA_START=1 /DNA_END=831 /DNA_ORIENTATION=+
MLLSLFLLFSFLRLSSCFLVWAGARKSVLCPCTDNRLKHRSAHSTLHESTSQCHSADTHQFEDLNIKNNDAEEVIAFVVYGEPVTLARHRSTRAGIMYNPSKKMQKGFLDACSHANLLPKSPLQGPLEVRLVFYFTRPKNHFGTGRNAHILKGTADVWHSKKKDLDNLVKFVLDSLNGYAYVDDSQIAVLSTAKLYCNASSNSRFLHEVNQTTRVATTGSSTHYIAAPLGTYSAQTTATGTGTIRAPLPILVDHPRVEVQIRRLDDTDEMFANSFS